MTADGVYVYAIIHAGRPLPTDMGGVGSPAAPLRTIRQGRVAAVVSAAPPKLRARRRDLLAHQDLLLRLSDQGPVLPMRFGMVAPDDGTVRGQLAVGEADHMVALEHLSDGVEVNVKAFPAQNALRSLVAEDRTVRRLRDEARRRPGYEANLRLGEAVAAALESRAAEAGRRLLRDLTPRARAVASGPKVQGCVLNMSFLVNRGDSDEFRSQAERFAGVYCERVDLRLAGPLPCYSFVSAEGAHVRTVGV
ncbi:GvpL/GvpF family gas vesicle protein [Streptomyces europaeiscabiei]|uniref:GvpL/GvpF family gas vesicle protein n=1 Tax=Streptomyces europaeiscabiei TaxID=146819 RepID=UPI0006285638|nr:GvpL/GvpF family gas vesicle protein [Streptomyces europaeiscabiei]MDX2526312.1 GvpL/GvpF family gas vesicle protein [Streptomyces europaeiscabiei]MDX2767773.1 GvpL/GvpF family gas vesicle protein [Streptomyces europaeiscabiei]MDX3784722.1 GvpL/GvpF family gas vesicle protein [Streptomyces europaeiscabiei]